MNNFQVTALDSAEHAHLFDLSDAELAKQDARRLRASSNPGFPCRVSLQDAAVGEEIILFNYTHHKARSPYQASGPIFIRKQVNSAQLAVNETPAILKHRLLSVRAYDRTGMMIAAETVEGVNVDATIHACFDNPDIDYMHIHNASPGCYNCLVERA